MTEKIIKLKFKWDENCFADHNFSIESTIAYIEDILMDVECAVHITIMEDEIPTLDPSEMTRMKYEMLDIDIPPNVIKDYCKDCQMLFPYFHKPDCKEYKVDDDISERYCKECALLYPCLNVIDCKQHKDDHPPSSSDDDELKCPNKAECNLLTIGMCSKERTYEQCAKHGTKFGYDKFMEDDEL